MTAAQPAAVVDSQQPAAARPARDTTVLFAGITPVEAGNGRPAAARPMTRCLAVVGQAVEVSGGRVVRSNDAEVMALFPSADAAAIAAARMQAYVDTISSALEQFSVRIGFQTGPVAQREQEFFGDTVNLALQLLDEAKKDQILTTDDTASRLGPLVNHLLRPVDSGAPQARSELMWKDHQQFFGTPTGTLNLGYGSVGLQLSYRGKVVLRRRQDDAVTIGRDPECGLGVTASTASRRHCTIERRGNEFVLRDHSTNGTFVTVDNAAERRILGGDFVLKKHGWLAFGAPRNRSDEVVRYTCV